VVHLPKPENVERIAEFKDRVRNSDVVVATAYIGINADQATQLRSKLREQNVELKIFKNTLVTRALDELELSDAVQFVEGPTAWAFAADPVAPAKVLKEFAKEVPFVQMRGGILEGRPVSSEQLSALADLPPRDMLLAKVVGTIAAPLRNLVGVLSAPTRNLVNVLDQIRKQKEEAGAAA
jgi:large subunit ribosomal protein L10